MEDKCKHWRSRMFCCACRYGAKGTTRSEGRTRQYERISVRELPDIPVGERLAVFVRDDI